MNLAFVLLVIYQIKHWVCDYPLQTEYMLGKFKAKGWVIPLSLHAGVHAWATLCISLFFVKNLWLALGLSALDFTVHFIMDRIKASPDLLGRFKALTAKEFPSASDDQKLGNKLFWWSLGIDQMVHHLTHYAIIYLILMYKGFVV